MEEAVTYTAGDISTPPDLRLLHFNDGMSLPTRSQTLMPIDLDFLLIFSGKSLPSRCFFCRASWGRRSFSDRLQLLS